MALSCSRLANNLSLIRLWSVRTNQIANGLSGPCVCHQFRHYSTTEVRRGLGRYVTSRLQWVNTKYEGFLKRRFPRFYLLYHTFTEGFKLLFRDARDVSMIKTKMSRNGIKFQNLSYREMEKLRQFRRNMLKGIPLVLISIPPFANYLVFILMYLFPRQVLIPHFWTPKQQVEFRQLYHMFRARQHRPILQGLQRASGKVKDSQLRSRLDILCSQVQNGANPKVSEILAVRSLFSGTLLGMSKMSVAHKRNMSSLLFLTRHLPGFLIGRRLSSHALELLHLDRALNKLGPHQLSDSEVRQACYLRGLNSDRLAVNQCREWLYQWLQISSSLKESDVSLLLHCLVFLSANFPNGISRT
ncbi:LETM1 domain-containing protein 1 [Syngnathus acus]|uniref:LETM1 domain-containing protein 1 n=1 Tax=Syngnathus acus TaxID=161584 RepID=UPI001885CE17|nr:LETM1 domain-containing protein 1 [Syngnathus acus]